MMMNCPDPALQHCCPAGPARKIDAKTSEKSGKKLSLSEFKTINQLIPFHDETPEKITHFSE